MWNLTLSLICFSWSVNKTFQMLDFPLKYGKTFYGVLFLQHVADSLVVFGKFIFNV